MDNRENLLKKRIVDVEKKIRLFNDIKRPILKDYYKKSKDGKEIVDNKAYDKAEEKWKSAIEGKKELKKELECLQDELIAL